MQNVFKIKDRLIEAGDAVDEGSTSVRLAWERHAREMDYRRVIPKERTDGDIKEQRNWLGNDDRSCCMEYGSFGTTRCKSAWKAIL